MHQIMKMIIAIQLRLTDASEKDRGATATEYALLVAFIALIIIAGVTLFGNQLNNFFSSLGSRIGIL